MPSNLLHFENVPMKCPKQFLCYIDFICRRTCERNSSLNFMYLVGFQASKICMSFWKIYCRASFEISSVKSPVFGLCDSLTPGLEESRVLRYLIRWVLWPSGQGAWFLNQGSYVRNHWVTSRSTQSFILLRLIKWVTGTSGNLVVQSKLPPWSGSSLEPFEPHP